MVAARPLTRGSRPQPDPAVENPAIRWSGTGVCGASCGTRRMSNLLREPLARCCAAVELSHRATSGEAEAGTQRLRGSGRNEDPHYDFGRGGGPVTGPAGSESLSGRGGRHPAASSRGLLMLIPSRGPRPVSDPPKVRRSGSGPVAQPARRGAARRGRFVLRPPATLATPITAGLPVGGRGPNCKKIHTTTSLRRRPGDGVGGVGGTSRGRGGRHRFRLKAEGLLMLIPSRGPHPLAHCCLHRAGSGRAGQVAAREPHTGHVPDTSPTLGRRTRRSPRRGRRRAPGAVAGRVGARRPDRGRGDRPRRPTVVFDGVADVDRPSRARWPSGRRTTRRSTTARWSRSR